MPPGRLRPIAGLIASSSGQGRYRGAPLSGTNPGVGLVFRSFALMAWLTVLDNVELGLQARPVGPAERRERALATIDAIGLDGFEPPTPASCPAACASAWPSPAPWCCNPTRS